MPTRNHGPSWELRDALDIGALVSGINPVGGYGSDEAYTLPVDRRGCRGCTRPAKTEPSRKVPLRQLLGPSLLHHRAKAPKTMAPFLKVAHNLTTQMTRYTRTFSPTESLLLRSPRGRRSDKSGQDPYLKKFCSMQIKHIFTQNLNVMHPEYWWQIFLTTKRQSNMQ